MQVRSVFLSFTVAPVRERGLKYVQNLSFVAMILRRSREGAWIEIFPKLRKHIALTVAPVRERGLKYFFNNAPTLHLSRSREGAWIEITNYYCISYCEGSRSREGAWIEMQQADAPKQKREVAPVRERGLKRCNRYYIR